jgi:hypothetical protein
MNLTATSTPRASSLVPAFIPGPLIPAPPNERHFDRSQWRSGETCFSPHTLFWANLPLRLASIQRSVA